MKYPVLAEGDLDSALTDCPVCKTPGFERAPDQLTIQHEPVVTMKQCAHCLSVSASRMPTYVYLEQLYEPNVYSSSLSQNDTLSRRCAQRVIKHLPKSNRQSLKILDYGGGTGKLAEALVALCRERYPDSTINATVVDIYPRENTDVLRYVHVDDFMASDEKFDFVLASAVLEHLPDPGPVFDKLFASGRPHALFYARTPYEITIAKYLPFHRLRWPRHLHDMGPDFWGSYCESKDISVIRSRTSIVETTFKQNFLMTLAAYCLKSVSIFETSIIRRLLPNYELNWHIVGGWEIYAELSPD